MNFLELCKETWREAGYSAGGPGSVNSTTPPHIKVISWVKQSYRMILDSHTDWTFLWNIKALTILGPKSVYTRAELGLTDLRRIIRMKVIGGQELRAITYETYRKVREDLTEEGIPTEYCVMPNGNIAFYPWPVAGTQLRVEHQTIGADLVLDGDIPVLPQEYHDAIVWQAVLLCATDQENPALQNRAAAVYNERLDNLNRDYRPRGPFV